MNKQYFCWTAFYTLARKEVVRFSRIWIQTILPAPITTTLYLLIFGHWVGRRLGDFSGNVTYIQYIAPGLILMSVITNSYANVVSSFFGAKFQRNIEEMYVSPMTSLELLLGFLTGGLVRGILIAVVLGAITLTFTKLPIVHVGVAVSVVLVTSLLFSTAGLLNGVFSKKFDDISIIPTFVLTPLTYLAGVFYAVSSLPPFWAKVSKWNPIFYMIDAFRYGVLGVSEVSWYYSLTILGVLSVLLMGIAWLFIEKGIGIRN